VPGTRPQSGKSYRCLGRVLGLECDVNVDAISVPDEAMADGMGRKEANCTGDMEEMLRFGPEVSGPYETHLVMTSPGGIEACRDLVLGNAEDAIGFAV
jgi:hypothetical protein